MIRSARNSFRRPQIHPRAVGKLTSVTICRDLKHSGQTIKSEHVRTDRRRKKQSDRARTKHTLHARPPPACPAYPLIPEFVGRLPVIATLEDLDEASLKLILTQPKNALVKQYQRLFEMEGVDLTVAAEALGAIARKAIDRKTGARGLRSIMEAILLDSMFDLPSLEGVKEVVISQQVVDGTARPLYMYSGGVRAS